MWINYINLLIQTIENHPYLFWTSLTVLVFALAFAYGKIEDQFSE